MNRHLLFEHDSHYKEQKPSSSEKSDKHWNQSKPHPQKRTKPSKTNPTSPSPPSATLNLKPKKLNNKFTPSIATTSQSPASSQMKASKPDVPRSSAYVQVLEKMKDKLLSSNY